MPAPPRPPRKVSNIWLFGSFGQKPIIVTTQEVHSKTAKDPKGNRELAKVRESAVQIKHHLISQEGEHLLWASQGQLHPNNSGEHKPKLGQLVPQVDGIERAEQLGVVDGEKEAGAGQAQGKTAEAKIAK